MIYKDIGDVKKKGYSLIYADPPWSYSNNPTRKGGMHVDNHYTTMKTKDLMLLPIEPLLAEHAVCAMWVTDNYLNRAIPLMESWGFKYKTVLFNWLKLTSRDNPIKNMGPWNMKSCELCLLGVRGRPRSNLLKVYNTPQLIEERRRKHSQKPDTAYVRLEKMFPTAKKLELFARTPPRRVGLCGR